MKRNKLNITESQIRNAINNSIKKIIKEDVGYPNLYIVDKLSKLDELQFFITLLCAVNSIGLKPENWDNNDGYERVPGQVALMYVRQGGESAISRFYQVYKKDTELMEEMYKAAKEARFIEGGL